MHLFPDELAGVERISREVDTGVELPVICGLANEFLRPVGLPEDEADACDRSLCRLLRNTSTSLKVEVAERLAHVAEGPRRAMRLLAYDAAAPVAVPVLRYSPLLDEADLAAIARLRAERRPSEPHLVAIASRRGLSDRVIDVLAARGTPAVLDALALNGTARFTLLGLCRLAMRSCRAAPQGAA